MDVAGNCKFIAYCDRLVIIINGIYTIAISNPTINVRFHYMKQTLIFFRGKIVEFTVVGVYLVCTRENGRLFSFKLPPFARDLCQ